jgi:glutathione peroxidase
MTRDTLLSLSLGLALCLVGCTGSPAANQAKSSTSAAASATSDVIIFKGLELPTLNGGTLSESDLSGKVVLIVNVASSCGYTGQYDGLQKLYADHRDKGLVVVGVPCNQFGGQESGSSEQIMSFTKDTYGVDFPLLAKQNVKGADQSPLFKRLMSASSKGGDVGWNFEKFLVGRDGKLTGRFSSGTRPDTEALMSAITKALGSS